MGTIKVNITEVDRIEVDGVAIDFVKGSLDYLIISFTTNKSDTLFSEYVKFNEEEENLFVDESEGHLEALQSEFFDLHDEDEIEEVYKQLNNYLNTNKAEYDYCIDFFKQQNKAKNGEEDDMED